MLPSMDKDCFALPQARISELQYKLRCAAHLPRAKVLQAYQMDNPKLHQQFQLEAADIKPTSAWIPLSFLTEDNEWQKVLQRGFTVAPRVAHRPSFSVGNISKLIEFTRLKEPSVGDREMARHAIVLCKLCVRSPYVMVDSVLDRDVVIPADYDSLVYSPDVLACPPEYNKEPARGDGGSADTATPQRGSKKQPFSYQFVLGSASQILPEALIVFHPDEGLSELHRPCSECEKNKATYFHKQTEVYVCDECAAPMMKMKMMRDFIIPVDKMHLHSLLGYCSDHPDDKATHFCPKCDHCVCFKCKIQGNHSSGEYADHPLIKVSDAYDQSKSQALEICGLTEEFKMKLQTIQDNIDARGEAIENNMASCKHEIQQWCDSLIDKVNDLGTKKLDRLRSLRNKVARKIGAVDWNEDFLQTITATNPPVDFLDCWPQHGNLRTELLKEGYDHPIEDFPDLSIIGMRSVHVIETREQEEDSSVSPSKRNQPCQKLLKSRTMPMPCSRSSEYDDVSSTCGPPRPAFDKKHASDISRSPFPNVLISSDLSPRSLLSYKKSKTSARLS